MNADVHRIDLKLIRRKSCLQQSHRDGVRLLSGGTGNAQHPNFLSSQKVFLTNDLSQGNERLRISKEESFWNYDCFNQSLQLHWGMRQKFGVPRNIRKTAQAKTYSD